MGERGARWFELVDRTQDGLMANTLNPCGAGELTHQLSLHQHLSGHR
jgi:hypothetical protein